MSITKQENELFTEWAIERGYGNFFVKDGVPNPEQFERAAIKATGKKCRICFVLKEAITDEDEKDVDMRDWVNTVGGRRQTWDNITRWTQAILDCGDYLQDVSEDDRKK